MDMVGNMIEELTAVRDELQYGQISIDNAMTRLEKCRELIAGVPVSDIKKETIIKEFFITFNKSNMSDLTLLLRTGTGRSEILEAAGSGLYLEHIESMLLENPLFFKDLSSVQIKGGNLRLFHETMITDKASYTLLAITGSFFFKASKFHMLSDIIMDLIRSGDKATKPIYNDLFEDVLVAINTMLYQEKGSIRSIQIFKFEYIPLFIADIGIVSIIELSDSIYARLNEAFRDRASIFRISLDSFLVFFMKESGTGELHDETVHKKVKLDFVYRGIVLPRFNGVIPYRDSMTVYDLFEEIYSTGRILIDGDIEV